jgi:dTDP-3-amino-3,4,6-trideoxy-alpha-D-glucose transaminase
MTDVQTLFKPAVAVPFLDLSGATNAVRAAFLADLEEVLDSGAFANGPHVARFEEAFAEFCGAELCVGLASGLDALRLALLAAGLEPGDEVLVPANTFVATLEAVSQAGGIPVPVDVSLDDYNLDLAGAAAALTPRTRFIMPVHLYGQMADMRAIVAFAEEHGLRIVEDACQAHGATRDGIRAGVAGTAGAFSFYPGKNLGAFGDAGALVMSDPELAAGVRALREHGQQAKYHHDAVGYTARLDTIQAIALLHKLPHLAQWTEERREAAAYYTRNLAGIGDLRLPNVPAGSEPVWHLYVIRSARRDELAGFLRERGIATGLHYPQPVHLSGAYAHLGYEAGSFPVTETLAGEILSLPIFPGMREEQLAAVVDGCRDFFADAA